MATEMQSKMDISLNQKLSHVVPFQVRWHFWVLGVIAIGLRLPLLGDQPYTDEGIYAAASYFDYLALTGVLGAEGWLLPKLGHLSLYPLVTSWVYFLPWEPFFLLRLVDAFVALAAGLAVYRLLTTAFNNRLIPFVSTVFFIIAVNHPVFINAGFKNSIMVAFTLTALSLAALHKGDTKACYQAGLLMAGAVLFREFFVPMGIVVALYSIVRCGWVGFLRFAVAGLLCVVVVITLTVLLRGDGGFNALVNAYMQFDSAVREKTNFEVILNQGLIALDIILPLIPLVCIGLLAPVFSKRYCNRENLYIYFLGISFVLCPALEIWYKPSFPYHFSLSVFGLVMLLALGVCVVYYYFESHYKSHKLPVILIGSILIGLNLFLFLNYARQYYWQIDSAIRFAPVMIGGDWKNSATEKSIYLRAARVIRENTTDAATMMTEYRTAGLFPLSSKLPSATGLGYLERVTVGRDQAGDTVMKERLFATPPDVFVLMPNADHEQELSNFVIELTSLYPRRIDQVRGLTPYGNRSAQIFLR